MNARVRALALDHGVLLGLITAVMYVWLAPHHVVDGDNAEFATLSVTGGAAHPSGYPLYVLWLRLTSWIPGASPAHTAAIATALLGAASVLVLHAACRAWGASSFASTASAAVFATGPVVLRVVTEAEVFAMNNLVVATVLLLAASEGPLRGRTRALALGLVAGLGLADHLTCVLVAPVGILGVIRGGRERGGVPLAIVLAVVGLVIGLLPYLYLLVAPETPLSWRKVEGLGGIVDMFLRRDYGGPTAFQPGTQTLSLTSNLSALANTIGRAWLYVLPIVGLGTLAIGCVRGGGKEPRAGWWMLAAAWLVSGPILVMRFNVPTEGLGLYVSQRFHLMPALLLAIPVAIALTRFELPRATLVNVLAATVLPVGLAATSLDYVGRVHSPAVETSAKNLLRSLPRDAVVLHGQDEFHAVTGYVQWALGERQDVRIVTWPLMTMPWYQRRVAERGVVSAHSPGPPVVQLVRALTLRGTPVFVDRFQRDVIETFATHPLGILIRVLPPGTPMPSVQEVAAMNEQIFAGFVLDYPTPGPDDEFATEVHRRYSATWSMIATMLERSGDPTGAARAREHAQALAPR